MNRYKALLAAFAAAAVLGACGGESPEALVSSGKDYLAKNDRKAAIIQLRNALQGDPNLAEARFLLGRALLESGDPAGAEKELRRARELSYAPDEVIPLWARSLALTGDFRTLVNEVSKLNVDTPRARAEVQTAVAQAYFALGNATAARSALTKALIADPKYVPALGGQARLAMRSGDLKDAMATVDTALAIAPQDPETLHLKGDLLLAQREPSAAVAAYRKAVEAKSDYLPSRAAIVSVLAQQKKLDEAAQELEPLKKIAPNHPQTLYLRALIAYRWKDFAAAREAIQLQLRAVPDNLQGMALAGAIEYELKNYAQAENYLTKVLQRAPKELFAWRILIATYMRSGQASKALDELKPMLNNMPDDAGMLALAGEVLMMNGEAKQAAELFEKAAKLAPDNSRIRTAAALGHIAQGESERGLRELEQTASEASDGGADLTLIAVHLRQREFAKALAVADRLERKQPDSPMPHAVRGGILLSKGDPAAARKSFERALEINPTYFPAAVQLAKLDVADNKPDAARQRFDAIVAKDPKHLRALLALAELRSRAGGTPEEVAGLIQKAVSANPTEPAARLALIGYYLRRQDAKNAMAAAQGAMAALPNSPQILNAAGQAHHAAGETNQAISIYHKWASLEPKSPLPLMALAELQVAAKQRDDAIESLRKALDVKPGLVEAQQGLLRLYVDAGRTKEAIALARDVQKQRPKESVGYIFEGDVYAAQKNWTEAAAVYRAGLKSVGSTDLAVRLHAALSAAGGGANEFANAWLKDHPKDDAFRLRLAEAAFARKDYSAAVQHYRKVLESAPKNALVLNNLAWAEGQIKDPKALEHAEEANRIEPNQPAIMDTLGAILVDRGEVARGLALLQKASAQAPQAQSIRLNLAKALLKAGQKDAARKELDELAKLGEKFPAQAEVAQLQRGL